MNTVVTTTFGAPITESTLDGAFGLSSEDGPVSGSMEYDSTTRTATFTPEDVLAFETEYTATWATSLRGTNDARLAREYSWAFTTGEDPAENPAVTGVTVTPAESDLGTGATAQLTATVAAVGGADESVTWTTSDPAIATVDGDGLVTGIALGTATITATSVFNTEISGNATVNVVPANVVGVAVTPNETTLEVGATQQLEAAVDAVGGADDTVTWASDAAAIATVDADGLVTAVGPGTATISATSVFDTSVSGSATINVAGVTGLSVEPTTLTLQPGDIGQILATVDALHGADESVTWTSDAESVATVDADGEVTAVAGGVATVTATSVADPAFSASVTVNVQTVAVTVSPTTEDLPIGGTATFTAAVTATGGADDSVEWASDNEAVATVSSTGEVTAVSEGTATITATSTFDNSVSDSASVSVHGALVVDRFVPVTIFADTGVLAEDLGVSGGLAPYGFNFTITAPPGWPEDYDGVPYDDIADIGNMAIPPTTVDVDDAGILVGYVAASEIDPEEDVGYWAFIIEVTDSIGQIDYILVELAVERVVP